MKNIINKDMRIIKLIIEEIIEDRQIDRKEGNSCTLGMLNG